MRQDRKAYQELRDLLDRKVQPDRKEYKGYREYKEFRTLKATKETHTRPFGG